jgi:hypothetical protein
MRTLYESNFEAIQTIALVKNKALLELKSVKFAIGRVDIWAIESYEDKGAGSPSILSLNIIGLR